VLDDFKQALTRVQSDYAFYIDCQANPAVALAGYDLSAAERATLTDPAKLSDLLMRGIGILNLKPSITVTVKGKHDWVNSVIPEESPAAAARDARVATEVEAIRRARTDEERTGSVVRLLEQIG
jgi:hypothetical protein